MQINRNVGALVGGTILILFGLLSLAGEVFSFLNWSFLWPFIVIGIGAVFFVAMFAGGKPAAGFAIPGSIIGGIGLVLLFQNITEYWQSMSYFWTVIIFFVGVGIYIMGLREENDHRKRSGLHVMKIGFILFIVFGAFFELLYSSFMPSGWRGIVFPVLLILFGGYLLLSRSRFSRGRHVDSSSSDDSLPPTS